MATYNGERYLEAQLNSIAQQAHLPDELVCCDDGSRDQSRQIIEDFAAKAPFDVRLYTNEYQMGHAQNFARAISLAHGDIIMLCDQDDVWSPFKVENVLSCFHSEETPWLVINNAEIARADGSLTGLSYFSQCKALNIKPGIGCCISFLRFMKALYLPIPENHYHDYWIKQLTDLFSKVRYIDTSLQIYRRHPSTASITSDLDLTKRITFPVAYNVRHRASSRVHVTSRLDNLNQFATRIRERRLVIPELEEQIETAYNAIDKESHALNNRQDLLTKARIRRVPAGLWMYLSGEYGYFSGWKSLLKDILLDPR